MNVDQSKTKKEISTDPAFQVGGLGVPGAQVESIDRLEPQHFVQQQQQQTLFDQNQTQQQQQQQPPPTQVQQNFPQQFQQEYQQSYYNQNADQTHPNAPSTSTIATSSALPVANPVGIVGRGEGAPDPGLYVGGLGVPGAQVELLPESVQAPTPQLDTVAHASAMRPAVGPFDPPAPAGVMGDVPPSAVEPPMIQIQREDSMRGQPAPANPLQYNPGQSVQYDAEQQHHNGGNVTTTSTTTTTAAPGTITFNEPAGGQKIHVASQSAVNAAAAAAAADASTRGRRRSSLAVLADKFRSGSRSPSGTRSPSLSRRLSRTLSRSDDVDDEVTGPYANVKLAQQEHMEKLRAEQEKNHVTTNVDGLPIPPQPSASQRRRSSVSHILGLDKPLLSR